jgi:hypothetical protein
MCWDGEGLVLEVFKTGVLNRSATLPILIGA